MSAEGQAATMYWRMIKLLINRDVYFEGRERKGASDLVNSMLNNNRHERSLYDMYFEVANLRLGRAGEKPLD